MSYLFLFFFLPDRPTAAKTIVKIRHPRNQLTVALLFICALPETITYGSLRNASWVISTLFSKRTLGSRDPLAPKIF